MRKMLSLLAVLVLCTAMALGQNKTTSGQVKDSKGDPIPFATIKIKGTNSAVAADANGNFSISAPANATFVISAVGFEQTEAKANSSGSLSVSLNTLDAMSEVVVTALGIKRAKNTLPYAAQQVSGEDVSRLRSGNAFSALSGKVAGLQIQQGNGLGSSTNIVIRGTKSISRNNQALFVVDGVPVENKINNRSTQQNGRGGYDYGNAAADINPDDIENINVLKGAAATALYGSRAANGVVMITTKKAKRGLNVVVNSGLTVNSIDKKTFATYQKEYGAGYSDPYQKDGFFYFDANGDGTKDLVVPTSEDASYGAKFDPNLMVYHWDAFDPASPNYKKTRPWVAAQNDPSDFYETHVSTNNSVMFDGASDKGSFKLGYTRNDEHGVMPNSRLVKNIINFGASYNIAPNLTANASVNYSKIDGKGRYGTGYSGRNVNQNFRQWYQTNVDIKEQEEAYQRNHRNITWNWKDPSTASGLVPIYTDNYYWTVYENYENDTRSRVFGFASLDFKATNWLSFLGRVSVDSYSEFQEERVAVGSQGTASYTRFDRSFSEINYDLMANVDKDLTKDLNLKGLIGVNMRRNTERSVLSTTSGGLVVPGLYTIANSKGSIPAPTELNAPVAVDGYFGGLTLTYQNYLTLDAAIRRDRSSTLPVSDNAYNYGSVSASWVFSHHLPTVPWLSNGKLRMNYAIVGNDAPWGNVKDVYDQPTSFGSSILFSLPDAKNNNLLVPEKTYSKEIGLEVALFNSRLGFDATYYIADSKNQIVPVATSTATGYSSKWLNTGIVQNKGIELSVFGTPVRTNNFSWNVNVNFTRNRNKVTKLYEDSKNLQLGSFQGGVSINATLDQPYGTIQGKTWEMKNGQRLVDANGYYVATTTTSNVIGNVNPDWIGGVYNTFKYKNVSLGFLVDVRKGGDVWSLDMFYAQYTGVLKESAGLNDLGKPVRNSLADGGGVILNGVDKDGKINTKRVVIDANSPANPQSNYSYDASYVKLREANLTYSLSSNVISKIKFVKGIDVSVFGRNLWIIHKNLPYADPEENLSAGNIQGMQSGAYPTTRSVGLNVKVKF